MKMMWSLNSKDVSAHSTRELEKHLGCFVYLHLSLPEHLIHVTPPTIRPASLSNLSNQQKDLQEFRNPARMEEAWFANEKWLT